MAVVTRHRAGGKKTYYVKVEWNGRDLWERIGADKRAARSRNATILREIREGVFQPRTRRDQTFAEWAAEVSRLRTDRSNEDDQKILALHVLSRPWLAGSRLDAIDTPGIRRIIDELRATVSEETGKPLSPKYVANIYGMVRNLFKRAIRRGLIDRDPCDGLERREVNRRSGKRRGIYGLDAIMALCLAEKVAPSARVFAVLAFLTGCREGEICGLRWSDWNREARPLTSLRVARQYDGRLLKTEKHEAGERSRMVPVHTALAAVLDWWWRSGFELVHARKPSLEDPMVPAKGGGHHTKSSAYKLWRKACTAAGVTSITLHSTRHTMITMARRGGAREDVLELVTHNARGTMVDDYTHLDWEPLCQAVLCIDLSGKPLVTMPVTSSYTDRTLLVEAPGIEEGGSSVTTGNDSEATGDAEPPRHLENKLLPPGAPADRDARHHLARTGNDRAPFPLAAATAALYQLLHERGAGRAA